MSKEQLTEDELNFLDIWYTPKAMLEILFHNWDNLNSFHIKKFGELRLYQEAMLSDESIIDFELTAELNELDKQEIFDCRKRVGDLYCLGSRKFGKSLITVILDTISQMLTNPADKVVLGSVDLIHIKRVLDPIKNCFESHPICKMWKKRIVGAPDYQITLKNDWNLCSVNWNIGSKNPGQNYFGLHCYRLISEEQSLETEEVYEKRKDAISELGAVIRASGMTNFIRQSPSGKIYYDPKLKNQILNLPQMVNPTFSEEKQKKAEEEYGGKNSIGYRVFVNGEIVEDGISVFDMTRIRDLCINEKKKLSIIEISKEDFKYFKQLIVLDRPNNAERIFISSDIGVHTTEINIVSEVKDNYEYIYNISLHNLTDDEQATIFKHLIEILKANVIAIDCGDGSIDQDEFVVFKVEGKLTYSRAKDLVKYSNKNITVPTWNNNKLEWKKAKVYSHSYKGEMLNIFSYPGNYNVRVTPNHSIMVYTSEGLVQKKANEIEVGDWLLSPKLKKLANSKNDFVKLSYKKRLGNHYSKQEYGEVLLNKDLGYLLGWAVAEGSSKTTNYQFSLGNDEEKEANNILRLTRKIFHLEHGRVYTHKFNYPHLLKGKIINKTKPTFHVDVSGGKGILEFFETLCGKGAHNKKIPMDIFSSPLSVQKSFLEGLLAGDGNIRSRRKNTIDYAIKIVSEELAYGILLLVQQLGFYPSIDSITECELHSFVVRWTDNCQLGKWEGIPYEVIPLKYGKTRLKKKVQDVYQLEKTRVSKEKINRIKELLSCDWIFKKVTKIEKYNYDSDVYDLMVSDNNTFVAGFGNLLIHNTGRSIFNELEKTIPKSNLVWYDGKEKIPIGFQTNEDGTVIYKDGTPLAKEERMAEWSVKRLKDLFYEGRIILPEDYKFISQFSQVIAITSGDKILYRCNSPQGDHLFDSFKVFAIAEWLKSDANQTPDINNSWGTGVNG